MKTKLFLVFAIVTATTICTLQKGNAQCWGLSGNSDATKSSKLGTTNAIPVRIFVNNGEKIRIPINGNIGIGTTNPAHARVEINGSVGYTVGMLEQIKPV